MGMFLRALVEQVKRQECCSSDSQIPEMKPNQQIPIFFPFDQYSNFSMKSIFALFRREGAINIKCRKCVKCLKNVFQLRQAKLL